MRRGAVLLLLASCAVPHFEQADGSRRLALPKDHAAHPDFKMEDWYWNGHLITDDGRRIDFFFSILRRDTRGDRLNGIPILLVNPQFYLGICAITDRAHAQYLTDFRVNLFDPRGAGADEDRPVWFHENGAGQWSDGSLYLTARAEHAQLHLQLTPTKPPALYGHEGFVAGPNDPHYLYSLTRMEAKGTFVDAERGTPVHGVAWFDHYLGDPHSQTFRSWDWTSLQLDDGTELMLAQLHRDDESQVVPYLSLEIERDGSVHPLAENPRWNVRRVWTSPSSKSQYRIEWSIEGPGLSIALTPVFDGQEFEKAHLWEGAMRVQGTHAGHAVGGEAFLETIAVGGLPRASFETGGR